MLTCTSKGHLGTPVLPCFDIGIKLESDHSFILSTFMATMNLRQPALLRTYDHLLAYA